MLSFNQECRLIGDTGRFHGMVGGSYARDKVRDDQPRLDFRSSSGAQNLVGVKVGVSKVVSDQSITTKAVFGSAEFQILDQVKILGGEIGRASCRERVCQ